MPTTKAWPFLGPCDLRFLILKLIEEMPRHRY
jgi:hypothetical protein